MNVELQNMIWERDKGICQKCGKRLTETRYSPNPKEVGAKELSGIKEIPVFKWFWECWNCKKETPIVSYYLEVIGYCYSIGFITKLDRILRERYDFVKRIYSESFGERAANFCVHCGEIQGNSYVGKELTSWLHWEKEETEKLLVTRLPNNLTVEDLRIRGVEPEPYEEKILPGEIHHKDLNWENDDPDNLVLLCVTCHCEIHTKTGRKSTAKRGRKEAKEERRIVREKKEADRWRQNYYALKRKREG